MNARMNECSSFNRNNKNLPADTIVSFKRYIIISLAAGNKTNAKRRTSLAKWGYQTLPNEPLNNQLRPLSQPTQPFSQPANQPNNSKRKLNNSTFLTDN